jgi:2,3-dihydroxybenzoate decarboxylase
MGEGIPYWLQAHRQPLRLQVKIGATESLPGKPSEYFLREFPCHTAGVTSWRPEAAPRRAGADRIMFAADFPYEDDARPCASWMGGRITDEQRRNLYETNASRVFKLKV